MLNSNIEGNPPNPKAFPHSDRRGPPSSRGMVVGARGRPCPSCARWPAPPIARLFGGARLSECRNAFADGSSGSRWRRPQKHSHILTGGARRAAAGWSCTLPIWHPLARGASCATCRRSAETPVGRAACRAGLAWRKPGAKRNAKYKKCAGATSFIHRGRRHPAPKRQAALFELPRGDGGGGLGTL